MADDFVRVRLVRIDEVDLNLFQFDLDLTFMVFFLNADQKIYGRYGGRVAKNAEERQSLEGLRFTMKSILQEHKKQNSRFANRVLAKPLYTRQIVTRPGGGCIHCHQAKEMLYNKLYQDGKWNRNLAFRYPPPDNLGLKLDVEKSNVIEKVIAESPAARVGLESGDVVTTLNSFPIHSFGDAQFALDKAPETGTIKITWLRNRKPFAGEIQLAKGWRRTDISWRRSVYHLIPSLHVFGNDLSAEEKKELGLSPKQTAFRQDQQLHSHARKAGIQVGDVILGINHQKWEMEMLPFLRHVRRKFLIGERVIINVLREGKRLDIPMELIQ